MFTDFLTFVTTFLTSQNWKKKPCFLHVDMDGSHFSSNKKMVGREGGMEKGKKVDGGIGEGEKKMVGG
jgi:hypothetical protein